MDCVILAGGLGTRMRPVTEHIPKALIPVLGRPFVDWQLQWLADEGVTSVVFCVGYKGELLREHVGDGSRWQLAVDWVDEGDRLRGTAGALRLALDSGRLPERFLVVYGDSYLPVPVRAIWDAAVGSNGDALMTVLRNDDRWDRSNAAYAGGMVTLYDKSGRTPGSQLRYIDYGLSVLSARTIRDEVAQGAVADLSDVFHRLSVAGRLAGYEVHERFFEVGSAAGLADLEQHLRGLDHAQE